MAFLNYLIISAVLVIGASANYGWPGDNGFANFPGPRMPTPPTPPSYPSFNIPAPFPPFPPSALFPPGFPNIQFPQIPMPVVPSPQQIKNVKPGPGQMFHGIAVTSSSRMVQDKDGKWVREGGTAAISNNNGEVREFSNGSPGVHVPKGPTPLKLEFPKFPSFPEMKPLEFPEFPEIKPLEFPEFPKMEPLKFPEFKMPKIKPIDVNKMKTYTPKEGETFFGTSSSSVSSSHTVNGKTVSAGAASALVNDNGRVDGEHVAYRGGDKKLASQLGN